MLELDARLSNTELPMHGDRASVARLHPGVHFAPQMFHGTNAPIQTLPAEHTKFDISSMQTNGRFGSRGRR